MVYGMQVLSYGKAPDPNGKYNFLDPKCLFFLPILFFFDIIDDLRLTYLPAIRTSWALWLWAIYTTQLSLHMYITFLVYQFA